MRIQHLPGKWLWKGIVSLQAMLSVVTVASAQGTIRLYEFNGEVSFTSPNPVSEVFPGVTVGSPVAGWFTIDYSAPDAMPIPNAGRYSSAGIGLGGTIGGWDFGSTASGGTVFVNNGTILDSNGPDFMGIQVAPGGSLRQLSLEFRDSTGQAIAADALPGSAAVFSAFPLITLTALAENGTFGSVHGLRVTITEVPEPAVMSLIAGALALLWVLHRGRAGFSAVFRGISAKQATRPNNTRLHR